MSSPTTFTFADDSAESYESDADLDIVHEIDKFLEGYTSDGAERQENNYYIDTFDDDHLKIFDTANVEKDHRTSLNHNDVEFVGKNSAVFHLLEDNEEYGIYEHIPNECNWNVFYKTLPPGEPNYSIKQEPINDGFPSNDEMKNLAFSSVNFQNSSIQPKIKLEPCSTENEENQEDTLLEEMPYSTFSNDDQNELENFSFLSQLNNIHNPNDSQYTEDQKFNNLDHKSKSELGKWKQNQKYDTNLGNKSPLCEYSKTKIQNCRKEQWNQKNLDSNTKRKKKKKFKKNFKNTYKFNPPGNCPSSFAPNDVDNSMFSSVSPPIHLNSVFNQPSFKELEHTASKMQGKKLFHDMSFSKHKKGFKNSKFKVDKSVCNQFRQPYKPFVPTNHAPPVGNIHKLQHSVNPYDLNIQLENKQHTDLPCHENMTNLDWKNKNPLSMQQDAFHISSQQYSEKWLNKKKKKLHRSQDRNKKKNFDKFASCNNNNYICPDNKEKVISNSQDLKNDVNFELKHVIKDYLCPLSLVGSTIKFTSRKLANTFIRDKLNMALNSYGTVENFWWTPDDLFFATYTSRTTAQHVFKIYPKNSTSSY